MVSFNTFNQAPLQGQMDLLTHSSVVSGQISANVTDGVQLVAGQPVKLEDSAAALPQFLPCAADSDDVFGFIARNPKDPYYIKGDRVEVAMAESIMYMTANAAIARNAPVGIDFAAVKVKPAGSTGPIVGLAYDKAAADGDMIRVYIKTPRIAASAGQQQVVTVAATLAEINAGKVLIPGVAGKQIVVSDFVERVVGAFAATTSVDLKSGTTAVVVEATAVAGLTNGAVLGPFSANVALGAGFGAPLPAGESLKVVNTGAAATTGTSITYTITYAIV